MEVSLIQTITASRIWSLPSVKLLRGKVLKGSHAGASDRQTAQKGGSDDRNSNVVSISLSNKLHWCPVSALSSSPWGDIARKGLKIFHQSTITPSGVSTSCLPVVVACHQRIYKLEVPKTNSWNETKCKNSNYVLHLDVFRPDQFSCHNECTFRTSYFQPRDLIWVSYWAIYSQTPSIMIMTPPWYNPCA